MSLKVGVSTTYFEPNLTNGQRDGLGVYTGNLLSSLKKINNVDAERCRNTSEARSEQKLYPHHRHGSKTQRHGKVPPKS